MTRLYDIVPKWRISANKTQPRYGEMVEPEEALIDGPFLTEGRTFNIKPIPIHLYPGSKEGAEDNCDSRLLCEILGHPKLIDISFSPEESVVEGILNSLYDRKFYGPYAVAYTPYKGILPFVPFPRDKLVQDLQGRKEDGFEHFISVEHNLLVGRALIVQLTSDVIRVIDTDQPEMPGVYSLTPDIRTDYNGQIGALLVSFRR